MPPLRHRPRDLMHSPNSITAGLMVVTGLALAFLGRRLFWLFVGALGFLAGMHFAPLVLGANQPPGVLLAVAVVLGLVGALLAICLERIAVALAGWATGGMLAYRLAVELGWTSQLAIGAAALVGAIVVAIVFARLFDWALIVFTTLVGAMMVSEPVPLDPMGKWVLAVVVVALGFVFQARSLARARGAVTE